MDKVRQDGRESGAEAMARDLELLRAAQAEGPLARVHGWSEPVLTLGRTQRLPHAEQVSLAEAGVSAVARPTGGGWLLHLPGDVALTVALPGPLRAGGLRRAARAAATLLAEALRASGLDARLAAASGRPRRAEGCFARTDRDELVVGGVKVAGVALARVGASALVQAAIPLATPGPALAAVEARWDPARPRATRVTGRLREEPFASALAAAARRRLAPPREERAG